MMPAEQGAPRGTRDRILQLDGLRGLAALAVTLYHYTWFIGDMVPGAPRPPIGIWWGCYGVQAFFAISGFVILMTLDRARSAEDFIRARFWRLFPTYWLAMAITFTVVTLFGPERLRIGGGEWLLNLPMLQLFTHARMVDGVYWSLNVELAFYACMVLLWRLKLTGRIELVLLPWLGIKWLWWAFPALSPSLGLLLLADHIPYFAIGILSYRIWAGQRRWFEQLPMLMLAFGTVLVIDPTQAHWLFAGLVPLFLALAARRLAWLAHPALIWLGRLSYPLYLLHAVIGYTVIVRLEAIGLSPTIATLTTVALVVLLAALVASGIDRFDRYRRGFGIASPAGPNAPRSSPA